MDLLKNCSDLERLRLVGCLATEQPVIKLAV